MVRVRLKRGKKLPQNWDTQPDEVEETPGIEPGDMVRLTVCLTLSDDKVDGHFKTKRPYAEDALRDDDDNPTLDGEVHGIYIGQKRLQLERKLNHNPGHWTGTRLMKDFYEMFHIFVFGGRRLIIDMEHVRKVQ